MQESDGQSCPFCRAEIKGTEQVIVDPFDPRATALKVLANKNSPGNNTDFDDDDAFEVCFLRDSVSWCLALVA